MSTDLVEEKQNLFFQTLVIQSQAEEARQVTDNPPHKDGIFDNEEDGERENALTYI